MIRPINMNEHKNSAADLTLCIDELDAKKLAAYAGRENICPEVFLRDVIAAGIKSYEIYGGV